MALQQIDMAKYSDNTIGILKMNFTSIVQYLDFESTKNFIEAFDFIATPCKYNKIVVNNEGEYSYLMDNLSHFNYLNITFNNIQSIDFDKLQMHINTLVVIENDMTEIPSAIEKYTNLKDLHICCAELTEINYIEKLVKIESLKLVSQKIMKIDNIMNLTNLTYLDLGGNEINKIENLENLVNLVYLSLAQNRIKKIENIGTLVKLKTLILFKNKISAMENLEKLKNLEHIDLSFNCLQEVKQIQYLPKLISVILVHNVILDTSVVTNYPNIQFFLNSRCKPNNRFTPDFMETMSNFIIPQKYQRVLK